MKHPFLITISHGVQHVCECSHARAVLKDACLLLARGETFRRERRVRKLVPLLGRGETTGLRGRSCRRVYKGEMQVWVSIEFETIGERETMQGG